MPASTATGVDTGAEVGARGVYAAAALNGAVEGVPGAVGIGVVGAGLTADSGFCVGGGKSFGLGAGGRKRLGGAATTVAGAGAAVLSSSSLARISAMPLVRMAACAVIWRGRGVGDGRGEGARGRGTDASREGGSAGYGSGYGYEVTAGTKIVFEDEGMVLRTNHSPPP